MGFRIIPLFIWLLIAAVPGYFGGKYYIETQRFIASSVETHAKIDRYVISNDGRVDHNDKDFVPWVEFTHQDGTLMTAPTNTYTHNDVHKIGQEVVILYTPDYIGKVRIKSFSSLYLLPTIFLGLAFLLAIFGLIKSRKPN